EWQTFWLVTLPNIRSAVLGAGLLVFTLSLDEIAVTFFLIGRQNTLPLQIWGQLRRGITPEVNAIGTVIFLVSVVVIVIWARLMREKTGDLRSEVSSHWQLKRVPSFSSPNLQSLNLSFLQSLNPLRQFRPQLA